MPIRQTLTPAQVSDLCEGLLDPSRSLIDIARRFGCSVVTLLELFYEPEIALRLKTAEAVARERARLLITNSLANAVHVLSRMLDNEGQAERTMPDTPKTHILALRSRDGARRAASLLLQIGRFLSSHDRVQKARGSATIQSPAVLHADRPTPIAPLNQVAPHKLEAASIQNSAVKQPGPLTFANPHAGPARRTGPGAGSLAACPDPAPPNPHDAPPRASASSSSMSAARTSSVSFPASPSPRQENSPPARP